MDDATQRFDQRSFGHVKVCADSYRIHGRHGDELRQSAGQSRNSVLRIVFALMRIARAAVVAQWSSLQAETVEVARIAQLINENSAADRELVTYGGPPIPIAAAMDDTAIKRVIGDLPSTPLEAGIRDTMQRFAALRDAGCLDTSDIESELSGAGRN